MTLWAGKRRHEKSEENTDSEQIALPLTHQLTLHKLIEPQFPNLKTGHKNNFMELFWSFEKAIYVKCLWNKTGTH